MVSDDAIRQQSINATKQWGEQWKKHAKMHSQFPMKNLNDFMYSGTGKACLLVANGYSFESEIETIKKYQDNVDVVACDKTVGHLLDHGITPQFVIVCDANVDYEKYLKPWKDKLSDSILLMNVCGNPKWSINGNWKDRYFFVNKDVLKNEIEFKALSGCPNEIPAGTNVSNAMAVFFTQSDEKGRRNFFGYDKYLLIGFDYCYLPNKKYYAFDTEAAGKTYYMCHIHTFTQTGKFCYTSGNLMFSCQWFTKYANVYKLPFVQCSKYSILSIGKVHDLAEQMKYSFKQEDGAILKKIIAERDKLNLRLSQLKGRMSEIQTEHHYNYIATV